jgi:simple sugar transport system ATP-binding protein
VLIAAHPTRGVDIGAQSAVWTELTTARDRGLATLLISADLDELLSLSDRLLVFYRGRIVAELLPADVDAQELGEYMTGVRRQGEVAA